MGKVIAAIVVIALLVLGYIFFFDTDVDTEGGSLPDVDIETEGELSAPDTDIDVDGPDIRTGEEEITVPTIEIDPADEGEADAEAEDDDPQQ